jgi:enoyl-CoA hydratase/carnithine racemase
LFFRLNFRERRLTIALLYEKEDKIVTITLNRPEARNAYDWEQCEEFSQALINFRDDPDAWVAIITGAGDKAFSAGADLKKLVPVGQEKGSVEGPPNIMSGLKIYKPLIAAVNGMALGGGLETVLACDIRIAAENAIFGTPEVRWSLMPGLGGTQRLPRMLPWAKAAELLLMGSTIDAQEAYRIGLVNLVVPFPELMPTAKEWARKICENGPLGVRAAKESMTMGIDKTLDEGLALEKSISDHLLTTEDAKEGAKAFAEKRKPVFKAR